MRRTAYGKQVMHRLIDLDKTQTWLVNEVNRASLEHNEPLAFSLKDLNRILTGERNSKYKKYLIEEILCQAEKS